MRLTSLSRSPVDRKHVIACVFRVAVRRASSPTVSGTLGHSFASDRTTAEAGRRRVEYGASSETFATPSLLNGLCGPNSSGQVSRVLTKICAAPARTSVGRESRRNAAWAVSPPRYLGSSW